MPADFTKLTIPLLIAVIMMFALYRRVRASVGRQRLRTNVLAIRMGMLTLVSGMILLSPFTTGTGITYAVIGAALGAGFAVYALHHTKFEVTDEGKFYTPHLYIGLAVVALLFVRVGFRFLQNAQNAAPAGGRDPFATLASSPVTLGILFLTLGYYLVYFAGLFREGRRLQSTQAAFPASSEA